MGWSHNDDERLKQLWLTLSASQIAAEFADGKTRNAIIGRAHRLGLSTKRHAPNAGGPPSSSKPRPRPKVSLAPLRAARIEHEPPPPPPAEPSIFQHDFKPPAGECTFPIGDPRQAGFRYCDAPTTSKRVSYCEEHRRLTTGGLPARNRDSASLPRPRTNFV